MSVSEARKAMVWERAKNRCEYRGLAQHAQDDTFHIEHVEPSILGGSSKLDNLALSCVSCNLAKKAKVDAPDPLSGQVVPLYHPRKDIWPEHFAWEGGELRGRSAVGRATIAALKMDTPRKVQTFQAQAELGIYPP